MGRLRFLTVLGLALCVMACASPPKRQFVLGLEPTAYGQFLAARYAGVVRDNEAARKFYAAALELESDNPVVLERAFIAALTGGDLDTAADLAGRMSQLGAADRLAVLVLAGRAIKDRRYRTAEALLDRENLGPFNRIIGRMMLAWSREGSGDVDGALAALAPPEDAPLLAHLTTLHRAMILERAGRQAEADAVYRSALASGVLRWAVVDAYGRSLERRGEPSAAAALYSAQLDEDPDDAVAHAGLERIARKSSPKPLVTDAAGGASWAVFGPAAAIAARAHADLALVYLWIALDIDPDNSAARYFLGETLARAGHFDAAMTVFADVDPDASYAVPIEIEMAWLLAAAGRMDEAFRTLESAVRKGSGRRAKLALGDLYNANAQYADAKAIYGELIAAIDGPPAHSDWIVFYARALANSRADAWADAEADLLTALELSPNQPSVLSLLGSSWVDRKMNLDRAFTLIRRAVSLEPDAPRLVADLGWAHYQMGEFSLAVDHLERAAALGPDSAEINDHLGDAYWRVGRELEARYQWSRALELDPEPDRLAALQTKLQVGLPAAGTGRVTQR